MTEYAYYNPDVLKWARERIGYSIEDAARKLNIKNPDKLAQAEQNDAILTVIQLQNAAKRYSLPVPYFYLDSIPNIERKQTQSFRLNTDADLTYSPEINKVLIWAQDIREDALWLADDGHMEIPDFQWNLPANCDINDYALKIRDHLCVNAEGPKNINTAFKWWKSAIESTGVLVLETEHYQKFPLSGAAIHFPRAPLIVLNGSEPFTRKKLFTLLHEFAHLLLEDSGLDEFQTRIIQNDDIERTCNQIARQILLPNQLLSHALDTIPRNSNVMDKLGMISSQFGISRFVVLFAMHETNVISRQVFNDLWSILDQQFRDYQDRTAAQRKRQNPNGGGPHPTVKTSKKLGNHYSRGVLSALWAGDIKSNEAVRMLDNLKVRHFEKFAEMVFSSN